MATIREYYEKAFPYVVSVDGILDVQGKTGGFKIPIRNHLDFVAQARFVSVLLPEWPENETQSLLISLLQSRDVLLRLLGVHTVTLPKLDPQAAGTTVRVENNVEGARLEAHSLDGSVVRDTDLPFTGRIYV